jgi:hypothetical protein
MPVGRLVRPEAKQTHDRAFDHSGKRVNPNFHSIRIDVEPAGSDQILGAPEHMDITVRVDCAEIAADEKAVASTRRR